MVGKSICALPFIFYFFYKVAFAHPLFIFPIPTTHMLTFIVQFEEIVLAFGIFFCPLFIAFLIVCPQQPPQQIIINYHKCRTLYSSQSCMAPRTEADMSLIVVECVPIKVEKSWQI